MGEIGNGQVYFTKPWCKTKCGLDIDFKQPYQPNDTLILQMNLTRFFSGLRVCEIYVVDMNGVRIGGDLKTLLGPAYYKHNIEATSPLSIFTLKVPPQPAGIQLCGLTEVPNPNCCYIDIYTVGDPHSGGWNLFELEFGGNHYDLRIDALPPGWVFLSVSGGKRYVQFPCDEVPTNYVVINTQVEGQDPVGHAVPVDHCPISLCDCYVLVPDSFYTTINRVIIGRDTYEHVSILTQNPSIIPGMSSPAAHTHIGEFWKIPIDCRLIDVIDFEAGDRAGGTWVSVLVTYGNEGCVDLGITANLNCFAFEFVMGQGNNCGFFSFYSEPYQCTDANCEYNELTAVIYSAYPGKTTDTMGNYVYNIGDIGDPAMNEGAMGNFVPPGLRIPALLLDLPTKVTTTRNEKCFMYKTEAVRTFKLQGTKAYPPYFARLVEGIMLGSHFNFDGNAYLLSGNKNIFEAMTIPAISAFRLNTELEWCNQYTFFNCV